jgi:hypothetical protein
MQDLLMSTSILRPAPMLMDRAATPLSAGVPPVDADLVQPEGWLAAVLGIEPGRKHRQRQTLVLPLTKLKIFLRQQCGGETV